jgi:hypothetical protein
MSKKKQRLKSTRAIWREIGKLRRLNDPTSMTAAASMALQWAIGEMNAVSEWLRISGMGKKAALRRPRR